MTFETEETRHNFHQLSTELQVIYTHLEQMLMAQNLFLHIEKVDGLEVRFRVNVQIQLTLRCADDSPGFD